MIIELVGQIIGQTVGISLAFCGWGVWGPLTGWGIRSVFHGIAPWIVIGLWPRVSWDSRIAWQMIKFGFGYVVATSISQSRGLVLLSVVGRVLGQESVGYMGLTMRAAALIAPFRAAASRVVLPALAPIAHIPETLRRGVVAVVETELLLSVPLTVLAVATYSLVVHFFLGAVWQQTAVLFPWVAAGYLLASAHAASLSALHLQGFFKESILSSCVGILVLAGGLACLGAYAGLVGCAAATVMVWPTYWIQEWLANKRLGICWSRNGVAWAFGGAGACLAWPLGPWLLALPAIIGLVTLGSIIFRFKRIFSAIDTVVPERA